MDTFIGALLGMDREAHQLLDNAQQYSEQIQKETEAEKDKLRAQCDEKAKSHIEDVRRDTQQQAEAEISEIRGRYEALTNSLQDTYHANRERWVQELYSRIV